MNKIERVDSNTTELMLEIGRSAQEATRRLARATREEKDAALVGAAGSLRTNAKAIIEANEIDLAAARDAGRPASFIDRLTLTPERVEAMAVSLEAIAELPDPVGEVISEWRQPNKLKIERVRTPLGVIGVIYESRPNVTADAGALCLKSGNASILRGGSESYHSARAIHACLCEGLSAAELPACAIQLVPTTNRFRKQLSEYVDPPPPYPGKVSIVHQLAPGRHEI